MLCSVFVAVVIVVVFVLFYPTCILFYFYLLFLHLLSIITFLNLNLNISCGVFLLLHCHIDLSNTFVHGSKLKYYFHVALFSADAVLHIAKPQSCAVCLIVNICTGI